MKSAIKMTLFIALITIVGAIISQAADRDRFVVHRTQGTVLDTKTNLMWAAKDNQSDVNWQGAKIYCENFFAGGYRDWRLPTSAELAGLYDATQSRPAPCAGDFKVHVATPAIEITCFAHWASDTQDNNAGQFSFVYGTSSPYLKSHTYGTRALPVRNNQ